MSFTATETAALYLADPTGSKRRQMLDVARVLPAKARMVAQARSACVRAIAAGVPMNQVAAQWRVINDYAAKLAEFDAFLRRGWDLAKERGDVSGSIPTETIVEPDAPGGLAGFVEIVGYGLLGLAIGVFLVGAAAVVLSPGTLGISGAVGGIMILCSVILAGFAWTLAFSKAPSISPTASGSIAIVAVAGIAALFVFGRRRRG